MYGGRVAPSTREGLLCHAFCPGPAARADGGRATPGSAPAAPPGADTAGGPVGTGLAGPVPDRPPAQPARRSCVAVGSAVRCYLRHRRLGARVGGPGGPEGQDFGRGSADGGGRSRRRGHRAGPGRGAADRDLRDLRRPGGGGDRPHGGLRAGAARPHADDGDQAGARRRGNRRRQGPEGRRRHPGAARRAGRRRRPGPGRRERRRPGHHHRRAPARRQAGRRRGVHAARSTAPAPCACASSGIRRTRSSPGS